MVHLGCKVPHYLQFSSARQSLPCIALQYSCRAQYTHRYGNTPLRRAVWLLSYVRWIDPNRIRGTNLRHMLLTLRARSSALNHFSSFFRVVLCNVKTACFPAAPLHMKSRSEIREIVQSATLMRRCWSPAIMSTLPYKSAFVDAGIASGSRCNPSLSVYGAHAKLGR